MESSIAPENVDLTQVPSVTEELQEAHDNIYREMENATRKDSFLELVIFLIC